MIDVDLLSQFHPAVGQWFRSRFQEPTPPQRLGWPLIAAGQHTLILAPTGSGKTLAAFLSAIDQLFRLLTVKGDVGGVFILYVSPLKALNNDIERNLREPLAEITKLAENHGISVPNLRAAVRTGDTPPAERQKIIKKPPHILITTPESLHLMLTSRACEILRTVRYLIVDEIHSLSDNKRGVFLSLLLERLAHLCIEDPVRIGLSATQRPLDLVGRFLGGARWTRGPRPHLSARPVQIVDTGVRRDLHIRIVGPMDIYSEHDEKSIWPGICERLLELIRSHRSTLVFVNNRAVVERVTTAINELAGGEMARPHHGSIARETRIRNEEALKQGELRALIATASLEMGIDMGAVDLVCQVGSPKSVSRGLQRVGRAGHAYTRTSVGRIFPKPGPDLVESVAISEGMLEADIAPLSVPRNCLDVLAQQIVAMVSVEPWDVDAIYRLVRQAFPYRDLPRARFEHVLEMLSGRYRSKTFHDLRPRVSWDRSANRLYPLPGSQRVVILNGGTIPDSGQYPVYLEGGDVRLGEVDEEFVYETRVGDVFLLGMNRWRVEAITGDRVLVSPAEGEPARMPFWRGEYFPRSVHLGRRLGRLMRQIEALGSETDLRQWFRQTSRLDEPAVDALVSLILQQRDEQGVLPSDRRVVLEICRDELGDPLAVLLTPFGGKVHLAWRLAILEQVNRSHGLHLPSMHNDDGILFRCTDVAGDVVREALKHVTADRVEELVLAAVVDSPLFGIRFRENAARALLLPRSRMAKRQPLWLRRIRAKDLFEATRDQKEFPITVETYRECLEDYLDLPALIELLRQIEKDEIELAVHERAKASPFASAVLFDFMAGYMYKYDEPRAGDGPRRIAAGDLADLLRRGDLSVDLEPDAVRQVRRRLAVPSGAGRPESEEIYAFLQRCGDRTTQEIHAAFTDRCSADLIDRHLISLEQEARIRRYSFPSGAIGWICQDSRSVYDRAFGGDESARRECVETYLSSVPHATPTEIAARYGLSELDVLSALEKLASDGEVVALAGGLGSPHRLAQTQAACEETSAVHLASLYLSQPHPEVQRTSPKVSVSVQPPPSLPQFLGEECPVSPPEVRGEIKRGVEIKSDEKETAWAVRSTAEELYRRSLQIRRNTVVPVSAEVFQEFLFIWQGLEPRHHRIALGGLYETICQLEGHALPVDAWEAEIFARRVEGYKPHMLDELCVEGDVVWRGMGGAERPRLSFTTRQDGFLAPADEAGSPPTDTAEQVREAIAGRGACFLTDILDATGLRVGEAIDALWELVWRGEVTNDRFSVIRAGKPKTVCQWDGPLGRGFSTSVTDGLVRRRGEFRGMTKERRFVRWGGGRWSIVPSAEMSIEKIAETLLRTYGVVSREVALVLRSGPAWGALYDIYRLMELRGKVRRGRFVLGLSGAQFALPDAYDRLQDLRRERERHSPGPGDFLVVSMIDPAVLYGGSAPFPLSFGRGESCPSRLTGNYIVFSGGHPVLVYETGARRAAVCGQQENATVSMALRELIDGLLQRGTLRRLKKVEIETWNGQPATHSPAQELLRQVGFERDYRAMIRRMDFNRP